MQIGILQTGDSPEELRGSLGNYDTLFTELLAPHGLATRTYRVLDGDLPARADAEAAWLITGSRHGAYDDLPWIAPLEAFIRSVHAARVPLAGICFGHQIIAQALGGKVEKYTGGWSVGRTVYTHPGRELALNAWHQDQVTRPPDGARVTTSSDFCACAGFTVSDHIWTIQAHPEFGHEMVEGLIRHRASGRVPPELIARAEADLAAPTHSGQIAAEMAAHLTRAAIPAA